jgi:hypothetical protein
MIFGGPFTVRIARPDVRIPARDDRMGDLGCGRGVESSRNTTVTNATTGRLMPLRAGDVSANLASEWH